LPCHPLVRWLRLSALIDTYIRAEESEKVSAFDDMSLVSSSSSAARMP
jgi:hypothetical protein